MTAADRDWIEELLRKHPPPSCRAISRQTGYSDWTIRRIKRELIGDDRPMKQRRQGDDPPPDSGDASPLVSWLFFGGFIAVLALAIWAGVRCAPPIDSTDFPHGFYPNPRTERTNDETEFPE